MAKGSNPFSRLVSKLGLVKGLRLLRPRRGSRAFHSRRFSRLSDRRPLTTRRQFTGPPNFAFPPRPAEISVNQIRTVTEQLVPRRRHAVFDPNLCATNIATRHEDLNARLIVLPPFPGDSDRLEYAMSVANVSSDYGNVDVEIFRLVGAPRPHHLRVNIVSCQGNVTLTLPKFFEGTVVIPNDRTMRMKRSPVVCTPGALGRVYKGYIRFETRDPELDGEEDVVYIRAHGKIRVKLADDAGQKRPLWEMWRGTKWVRLRPSS